MKPWKNDACNKGWSSEENFEYSWGSNFGFCSSHVPSKSWRKRKAVRKKSVTHDNTIQGFPKHFSFPLPRHQLLIVVSLLLVDLLPSHSSWSREFNFGAIIRKVTKVPSLHDIKAMWISYCPRGGCWLTTQFTTSLKEAKYYVCAMLPSILFVSKHSIVQFVRHSWLFFNR